MPRRNLWLCLPPVVAVLFDNAMTLWHQDAAYWAGQYWRVREAAPHGNWLLRQSPYVFEGVMLAYLLVFCFMIAYLPRAAAMVLSTSLFLGHLIGATTWISWERPLDGYWINLGICVLAAVMLVASYYMTLPPPKVPEPPPMETPEGIVRMRDHFSQN
jgi:hypothetical protein